VRHATVRPAGTLLVMLVLGMCGSAVADGPILAEVALRSTSKVERDAGVWLDGQYMGYLKELRGKSRLVLVPGEHELLLKLAGYQDLRDTIVVEPGERHIYRVAMQADPDAVYPDRNQTATLRISVEPERAAVFVNDVYAGHVDRFNGRRGVRMSAGTYRVKIALPGYRTFETEITLRADQDYEIKTELPRGSIAEATDPLIATRAAQ